ncbi:hypothetical protein A3D78_02525 [Candidatus Gottesmanbacteria bacterium RIFCSPHIGHO2_02_FULL_39_14]|uniref:Uncharacterized protein n=2 Tax=Candidatus Gottesmaniibacteriota TaxID=1752720 RepID=A0A1F5ZUZ4_9BACT|nr:MAG: hypothetical protein A3D78_02525 [Candidatus Gottesmanbacteria bacterium RIFCSPHIGHO2_02_FULL_39_14]OGG32427.1 MAG: hypothetical protein A3I51_06080 [Candidatus Gottesmanbacteria bacterium RIFCSPLOWO2_02_FULL_38_8]
MNIVYHKIFLKDYKQLSPTQKEKLEKRLRLFFLDEFNPILNNHPLKGKYLGYRSINVTGDLRAIYKKINNTALFVTIDSHSNLYK